MTKKIFFTIIGFAFLASGMAQLKVNSAGKVQINNELEISNSNSANSARVKIKGSGDLGSRLMLENTTKPQGTGKEWHIFNMAGSYGNSLQFWVYDDPNNCGIIPSAFCGARVIFVDDGRVGIGKKPVLSASLYSLETVGHVCAAGSWLSSDERLKTDIKPLFNEMEKLYLLQGRSYKKTLSPTGFEEVSSDPYRKEKVGFPEYGYLAQELKEIFPDLVVQDSAGYYSVNYVGLIPIIVEALKDQRLEIEKQREQIKQLVKLMDIKSINEKVFEENGIESIPLLLQNTPNPFNQVTEIGYYIPENVNSANIYIYDINGFQQKNISISERGKGATTLQASALQAGIYFYTLICDGKPVDTKQMILTR
jgi:hypothetical protein